MLSLIFFFVLAFLVLLPVVAFSLLLPDVLRFSSWLKNNCSPIIERDATFVSKCSRTLSMHEGINWGAGRTDYFATFEAAYGKRTEYSLDKESYNRLAEGARGTLTVQGIRFKQFRRDSVVPVGR